MLDSLIGLVRIGFRDYDPLAGRWTASDPALFAGSHGNLYTFVGNNPVNRVDSSGLLSLGRSVYDGIGGGIKISITGDGMSVCFEVGFGVGAEVELDPFGDLDPNGDTIAAEVEGKLGPGSGKIKIELNCQGEFKSTEELRFGPFCAERGENAKVKVDPEDLNKPISESVKKAGMGIEGKIYGTTCRKWFSW